MDLESGAETRVARWPFWLADLFLLGGAAALVGLGERPAPPEVVVVAMLAAILAAALGVAPWLLEGWGRLTRERNELRSVVEAHYESQGRVLEALRAHEVALRALASQAAAEVADWERVQEAIDRLREEIAGLEERLAGRVEAVATGTTERIGSQIEAATKARAGLLRQFELLREQVATLAERAASVPEAPPPDPRIGGLVLAVEELAELLRNAPPSPPPAPVAVAPATTVAAREAEAESAEPGAPTGPASASDPEVAPEAVAGSPAGGETPAAAEAEEEIGEEEEADSAVDAEVGESDPHEPDEGVGEEDEASEEPEAVAAEDLVEESEKPAEGEIPEAVEAQVEEEAPKPEEVAVEEEPPVEPDSPEAVELPKPAKPVERPERPRRRRAAMEEMPGLFDLPVVIGGTNAASGAAAEGSHASDSLLPGTGEVRIRPGKPGEVSVVARVNIGLGDFPYVRGTGGGLREDRGTPLKFVEIGRWEWHAPADGPVTCWIYRNDRDPATDGPITIDPGQQAEASPRFS